MKPLIIYHGGCTDGLAWDYFIRGQTDGVPLLVYAEKLEDGADVSEVAKSYGGGGHKHAAGFQIHVAELHHMLEESEPIPEGEP